MPRVKDVGAYPLPIRQIIKHLAEDAPGHLTLEFATAQEAWTIRNVYYSCLRAMERYVEKLAPRIETTRAARDLRSTGEAELFDAYIKRVTMCRRYVCEALDATGAGARKAGTPPFKLIWTNREAKPLYASLQQQLSKINPGGNSPLPPENMEEISKEDLAEIAASAEAPEKQEGFVDRGEEWVKFMKDKLGVKL